MDAIELAEQVMTAVLDSEADAFDDVTALPAAEAGLPPWMAAFVLLFPATGRRFVVTVAEEPRPTV